MPQAGVIPRSVREIFRSLDKTGSEYNVRVSFLELYNEEMHDMLSIDAEKKLRLFDGDKKALLHSLRFCVGGNVKIGC